MDLLKDSYVFPADADTSVGREFYIAAQNFVAASDGEFMHEMVPDKTIDEFDGTWLQLPIYMKTLICAHPFIDIQSIVALHKDSSGVVDTMQYNLIGANTDIPAHIDSDLTLDIVAARLFIPILPTDAVFTGVALNDDYEWEEQKIVLSKKNWGPIVLDPREMHSFKQGNKDGHYMICDRFNKDAPPDRLQKYLMFAINNYMGYGK